SPLMTLSTLPRVMGPGEEISLPVNLFVTDRKIRTVQLSVQSEGVLKTEGETIKSLSFSTVGDTVIFFRLKAAERTGAAQVKIKASGGGASTTETIDIAVRNPNPPVIIGRSALIDPNGEAELLLRPGSVGQGDWARLELSRMPMVN